MSMSMSSNNEQSNSSWAKVELANNNGSPGFEISNEKGESCLHIVKVIVFGAAPAPHSHQNILFGTNCYNSTISQGRTLTFSPCSK